MADVEIPLGASWAGQGMIAFSNFFAGFLQVPDAGGTPQPITRFAKGDISQGWPEFLPSGKAVLLLLHPTLPIGQTHRLRSSSLERSNEETCFRGPCRATHGRGT